MGIRDPFEKEKLLTEAIIYFSSTYLSYVQLVEPDSSHLVIWVAALDVMTGYLLLFPNLVQLEIYTIHYYQLMLVYLEYNVDQI